MQPSDEGAALPVTLGLKTAGIEVSDGSVITTSSRSWQGVMFDCPLRRTHNWFEV